MSADATAGAPLPRRRSPVLGIIAVVIAVESASVLLAPNPITNLLLGLTGSTESGQYLVFFGLLTAAGLAAVIVGLVAAITGRGRGWGVTAIALAIVGNIQVLELIRALVAHSA